MAEPLITLVDVAKTYCAGDMEVRALQGVSLHIDKGEFVAIMGASGSGKSTLMAILGCLDRPTSGRYYFEGVDVAGLSEPALAAIRSEKLGFVFQSFNLLPRTSALENVELPLFYAHAATTAHDRVERAAEGLALLGLRERARNTPGQLSGGQQQRVAIARALVNSPSVLLADEPTGNLDSRTSHEIMDTLTRLNRERGVTIITVTHEPDIAAYADRVITMRDGQIVSDTRKAALGSEPRRAPQPSPQQTVRTAPAQFWAFGLMIGATALQAIMRNAMRSALTTLGIFIGVAALIAMVAVGQGANESVRKQIESLGTNLLVVVPGATTSGGMRAGFGSASTLTVADARAILREDRSVGQIGYLIRQAGQVQSGNQNWSTSIQGVTPAYPPITNWRIAYGRGISEADDNDAALVVVLGQTVWHQLFGETANPIGATLIVKNTPLRVIGVLAPKGQSSFGTDQDDLVMIPFTTAERKVLGVAAPSQASQTNALYNAQANPYGIQPRLTGYVNQIYVQAVTPGQVQSAIAEVTRTLAQRHRIRAGGTNDFSVRNLSQIASAAEGSSRTMAYLLAAVASISLLVGGIGIMNILLVSVTERTREIGLRMAIGARRLHVLLQFLAEAMLLSLAGGAAGILGGVGTSYAISAIAGWPTPIAWPAIIGGFLFSAAVGIFFGYYPARKAAHFDPIEALRYE
ncbi:MAG TPA: ABC transporter permease [Rhizomicrobium sp.]|nr:ABC transporter permease [Rhizomicrobium sp.]